MSEQDDMLRRARALAAQAEACIERMYEAHNPSDATARYSDAKEALHDAIGLAQQAGDSAFAEQLTERLMHLKQVFRSQFS
jgi:hypothetical protein